MAAEVVSGLLYLEALAPDEDVRLYINCPGGMAHSVMGIYDTMQYLSCDVQTVALGVVGSSANLLLAGGADGKRMATANARIMLGQPLAGAQGNVVDVTITSNELVRQRAVINELYSKHSGLPASEVAALCDRDRFLSGPEAKKLKFIDEVIDEDYGIFGSMPDSCRLPAYGELDTVP